MVVGVLLANVVESFPSVATPTKASLLGPHVFKRSIAVKQVCDNFLSYQLQSLQAPSMLLSQFAIVQDSFPFVGTLVFVTSVAAKITYELIKSKDEVIALDDIIDFFRVNLRSTEANLLSEVFERPGSARQPHFT